MSRVEGQSSQSQSDDFGNGYQDEGAKSRQARANKFYSLAAKIESSTKTMLNLMAGKKERYGAHTYLVLTEEQDAQFSDALGEINKLIAEAQTMLDSYIELDKSTPKFENYLNLFYNLYEENITKHTQTIFFMVHARDDHLYLYPYFGLQHGHFGFNKLSMLLSRIRGTLTTCGDYTLDEPPAPAPRPDVYGGGYPGGRPYYSGAPYGARGDWRDDWDRERRTEKKEPRDIGDAHEQRSV